MKRSLPSARAASTPPVRPGRRRPGARAASTPPVRPAPAGAFAALGDPTRLALLNTLSRGEPASIAQLARGSHLTRQAITKHLRVLERARMVRCARSGRERLFSLDLAPVHEIRDYLDRVSAAWDQALARLQAFVEHGQPAARPAHRPRR